MFSYIRGIILILVTTYVGLIYGSVPIIMLAFMQLLIMVFSFLCIFIESKKIKISIDVPIPISEKGAPVSFVIMINNSGKVTLTKLKIHQHYNGKSKWVTVSNVTKDGSEARIKLSFKKSGKHIVAVDKIKIYDPLGFYYVTKKINEKGVIFIIPEVNGYSIRLGETIRNFEGDADAYDELRAGNDPTETFQIREYRAGDKVQSIHWKLSVKNDDIYVRENSFPKACPVVLMLNNANLEKLASVSFSLMDAGCPHFCSWRTVSTGEMIRGRVDDEESFYLMLISYMQDGSEKRSKDLMGLYKEKYHENNYLHWIMIEDDVYIDGEVCGNEEIVL